MATEITDASPVLAAFADPDTPIGQVFFKGIAGVTVDWSDVGLPIDSDNGQRYVVTSTFPDGTVGRFYQFGGTYPPRLDETGATYAPGAGQSVLTGTVAVVISDGVNDVAGTYNFYRDGVAVTPPPAQITNTAPVSFSAAGTAVGDVLTSNEDDTWTFTGTLVRARAWLRENALGNFVAIAGETGATYTLAVADQGWQIKLQVLASDDNSPPSAETISTAILCDPASSVTLTNNAIPTVSGTPSIGGTLTVTPGNWTGDNPVTLTYQWQKDTVNIGGQTGTSYTVLAGDVGSIIRVVETATEGGGDTESAASNSAGVLIASSGGNNFDVMEQEVLAEFATSPNKGWAGFTSETGFTIFTETTPDAVLARIAAWANATPATELLKIKCDWDGILNASSLRVLAVKAAKLTAGSDFAGYALPTGGVWLEAVPGKRPIWGTKLEFTGMTRLHSNGIHFGGKRAGTSATSTFGLKFTKTAAYPVTGCIYIENNSIGQFDNQPGYVFADVCKGINVQGGYSYRHYNVRFAGTRNAQQIHCHYIYREFTDAQQHLGDFRFTSDPGSGIGSAPVYLYDNMALVRDCLQEASASGLHTDTSQLGSAADNHGGYFAIFKNQLTHIKSSLATDSGSQGYYNDDYAGGKFEMAMRNVVAAYGGWHAINIWDPSQAGRLWADHCFFFRAGEPNNATQTDTQQQVNVVHGTANGGSRHIEDSVLSRFNGQTGAITSNNITYVKSTRNLVSGTGLTEAQALRIEDYIAGTVSRDGTDFMTYTLPGENTAAAATAWQALQDFYEPQGSSWAAKGVVWPAWTAPSVL